jgi:hypothetical protein
MNEAMFHHESYGECADYSQFPDFPSAVRWLHRRAAAVDESFAKAFPVPE